MKRVLAIAAAVLVAACGNSPSSPDSSSSNPLAASRSFAIAMQQVSMTANTVAFSWTTTGATAYKVLIGSSAGKSDVLTADVNGTSYTWAGPRTSSIYFARVVAVSGGQDGTPSTEIPVFTLDMRNMIDALYFGAGPLSQTAGLDPTSFNQTPALIWGDGITVNVLVTSEAGSVSLANAQTFVADYLAAAGHPFAVNVSVTAGNYHGVIRGALPPNTIVIRVDQVCTAVGVIACADLAPFYGRGFVNMNAVGGAVSIAHEIGHAFGLSHMTVTSSARPEFRFLMNPALVSTQMTDVEKATIAAARAGGLRANMTRGQAIALGLVLPSSGSGAAASPLSSIIPTLRDVESLFVK
jgi:hypothetical protein